MNGKFDFQRFLDAQASDNKGPSSATASYADALNEIRAGRKRTHWIWYVFPILRGQGSSSMSLRYAISGLGEARAYLADPVLGARLTEITRALLEWQGSDPAEVMGYDAYKLHQCMTLFALASGDDRSVFERVLDKYFEGRKEPTTLELLKRQP